MLLSKLSYYSSFQCCQLIELHMNCKVLSCIDLVILLKKKENFLVEYIVIANSLRYGFFLYSYTFPILGDFIGSIFRKQEIIPSIELDFFCEQISTFIHF